MGRGPLPGYSLCLVWVGVGWGRDLVVCFLVCVLVGVLVHPVEPDGCFPEVVRVRSPSGPFNLSDAPGVVGQEQLDRGDYLRCGVALEVGLVLLGWVVLESGFVLEDCISPGPAGYEYAVGSLQQLCQ